MLFRSIQGSGLLSGLPTYYSYGGHAYVQISDVVSATVTELGKHPTAFSNDPWRPFQEALKNVFDAIGSDKSIFVF